ncbi:hypothetical protein FNV43_RR06323 [Rhamnella rubrinervis]|uniref:Uncharacterized protein n=1 Tax=Rhamnella rubrinervis TaxID=2594499 RepID=A0A8K0HDQ1_9ROSA|nr:hypothetical protein FNV43_RR06323 [Rhamnella rubrinervis]
MPLPWKKTGVNRISQIVADIHSPKHGGSLVVETGFPTSLVDLFVKNRDRMRKSKNKRKRKSNSDVVNHGDDVHVAGGGWIGSEKNNSCRIVRPSCGQIKNLSRVNEEKGASHGDGGVERSSGSGLMAKIENQNRSFVVLDDEEEEEEECVGRDSSAVIMAALKVFVVVVLALSTKRLALGITLSAFVLLFVEFVSKRLVCFLKPCSKAKVMLNSMTQKDFPSEPKNFDKVENHNKLEAFGVSESSVVDGMRSNSSSEEIEIADSKREEFSSTRPELAFLSRETKSGSLDMEDIKTKAVEDSEALVEKHKHKSKRLELKPRSSKKVHEQEGVDSESSGFDGEIPCKVGLEEPVMDEKKEEEEKAFWVIQFSS